MAPAVGHSGVRIKRAYLPPAPGDGVRVLVDRLWPRGVSKSDAAIDSWMKDLAPSTELRRWFGHDPSRWDEFQRRYRQELAAHLDDLAPLLDAARRGDVTLVYGARDPRHNQAVVLKQVLDEQLASGPRGKE